MEVLAMKKLALAVLFVALVGTLAMAQGYTGTATGNLNYIPNVDVMGAHENGGRGCAGCHAPHSGGRGSGGNILGTSTVTGYGYTPAGTAEGDTGLWGTDTNPIETGYAGGTITFAGSYPVTISGLTWSSGSLYTGVVTCLSCHDGNVSKGAMMSGVSYEQAWGLLNFATSAGSNGTANAVTLYGTQPIPTLLGNDGGTLGDYSNDHPLGPKANLGAVAAAALANGLSGTVSGTKITWTVNTASTFGNFVASYGYPAIASMAVTSGDTNISDVYVTCTTCHNQHVQNVYSQLAHGAQKIFGGTVPAAAKIFYVNGPYNPGAPYNPTHVPSTMRFCQQCHFSMSSEYYGATNVGTAF
jgi:hypothetical protein